MSDEATLERVARAIHFAGEGLDVESAFCRENDGYWAHWWVEDRVVMEAMARAALEALIPASPIMLAHGWAAINEGRTRPVDMAPGPALREAFPAMIRAVLAAPPTPVALTLVEGGR